MRLGLPITTIGTRLLLYRLIALEMALAVFHLVVKISAPYFPWGPVEALFDLDEEKSIPTWFSIVQLYSIGAVLVLAAFNNQHPRHVPNWLLATGAAAFIFLSVDEGAMLHERLTGVARRIELDWLLFGDGRGAWILPYLLAATAVLLIVIRPLMRLAGHYPSELRIAAGGAATMAVGAVGFELVSYYTVQEADGLWYEAEVAGEELLEMLGASLILYAALLLAVHLAAREHADRPTGEPRAPEAP